VNNYTPSSCLVFIKMLKFWNKNVNCMSSSRLLGVQKHTSADTDVSVRVCSLIITSRAAEGVHK